MKGREQALLFLRKAAQDESLLDAVLECDSVSDEVIGFHCQQAAEKMLKASLSDLGITFHKTHELGALMNSLARSGAPLPGEFENLDVLTPFGAVYRYDDYDGTESLNRAETRALLKSLRAWVEGRLRSRAILEEKPRMSISFSLYTELGNYDSTTALHVAPKTFPSPIRSPHLRVFILSTEIQIEIDCQDIYATCSTL